MNSLVLKKLKELENTSWDFRNIAREAGIILNTIIKVADFKNVLEGGTSNGYSTIWLAEALSLTGGHIITIDIDPEKLNLAKQNFKESQLEKYITAKEGDSYEIMRALSKRFDMIFIDGGEGYFEIFNLVDQTLLKPRGVLAVDNVISHREKHIKFIEAIENNPNYQTVTLPFGGGLLLATKLA